MIKLFGKNKMTKINCNLKKNKNFSSCKRKSNGNVKCYVYTKNWDKDNSVILSEGKMPDVIDRAESYHRKKFRENNPGGWSCDSKPYGTKKVIKIPKTFKYKQRKPDFIDRLIAYESGELSPTQETKFLKEIKRKNLQGQLQGHYGREIERREL